MGACFTTVCTLTLLPYKNIQWPRPYETLQMTECFTTDWDVNFAQNAPFLEDNLCISYQGSQCMGSIVTVFPCADFEGVPYVATLEHNSGTVCLPYEVKTSASSIFVILGGILDAAATPAVTVDATADATVAPAATTDATDSTAPTTTTANPPLTTLNLQSLADNGLIAQDAITVLQQADQNLVRAALRNIQQMDPTTLAATFATIPLSSDEVSALLASATTVVPLPAAATSDATAANTGTTASAPAGTTTTSDASDAATPASTDTTTAATTTSDASDAASASS